ncbi:helix-turn-helix domain-containing protein [Dasania marina]|uniref:winged helix-turn-helix transcriptional regulator n=1 Tax=Dasania marina TaxID=471499 RepID=UPI0030D9C89D|tara:strand:- start:14902 stop:15609 length:708 start_codon:yes stop_codon:yes gene_type:complete
MNSKIRYGQYCPLAMSAEFLCNRWTVLIFRELLFGSSAFNDICRGVPRMSRTLLSNRLKELIEIGLITHHKKQVGGHAEYLLTDAGKALETVVFSMAQWGQEWLKIEPSVEDVDVDLLMWDIRRNTKPLAELPNPFIVHFFLTDVPDNKSEHWLVYEDGEVDLCHIDQDFASNVIIEVAVKKLTKVWMGWEDFEAAKKSGSLKLKGPKKYTDIALSWLGQSSVAHIKKQARELRV